MGGEAGSGGNASGGLGGAGASAAGASGASTQSDGGVEPSLDGGDGGAGAGHVTLGTIQQWTASKPAIVNLGTDKNRFCALTGVWGALEKSGAWMDVSVQGGAWMLTGTTGPFMAGEAACVEWVSGADLVVEPPFAWKPGTPAVTLGGTSNRFCALVRLESFFGGAQDSVRIEETEGQFVLSGKSGAAAKAQCISWGSGEKLAAEPEFMWSQGQPPLVLGTVLDRGCWLVGLQGRFAGGGESVKTSLMGASGSDAGEPSSWSLTGTSAQSGVAGWARCLSW